MVQEKIQSITIENIKGIEKKVFNLDIIPNKPSILVAPNGFGKSSFAIAFNSLNRDRIKLKDEHFHKNDLNFIPKISLSIERCGNLTTLEADSSKNEIFQEFSCFVINSQLYARGKGSQYGRATATLEIEDIVLENKIPRNEKFNYSLKENQKRFGNNSKVLTSIRYLLDKRTLIVELFEKEEGKKKLFDEAIKVKNQKVINSFIKKINTLPSNKTKDEILTHIENNLSELRNITCLKCIADIIKKYEDNEVSCYLSAIQFIWLYDDDKKGFEKVYEYSKYIIKKANFKAFLSTFDST